MLLRLLDVERSTLVNLVAPLNALSLMLVTVLGIVTLVKNVALLNAKLPMLVTPLGMFAVPVHDELPMTTLFWISNDPLYVQRTCL
jgi:hypothetical protein